MSSSGSGSEPERNENGFSASTSTSSEVGLSASASYPESRERDLALAELSSTVSSMSGPESRESDLSGRSESTHRDIYGPEYRGWHLPLFLELYLSEPTMSGSGSERSDLSNVAHSERSDPSISYRNWNLPLVGSSMSDPESRESDLSGRSESTHRDIYGPEYRGWHLPLFLELYLSEPTMSGSGSERSDLSNVAHSERSDPSISYRNWNRPLVGPPFVWRSPESSASENSGERDSSVLYSSGSESSSTSATGSVRSLLSGPPLSSLPLLGSFEESALQGRLRPVSTVLGFRAELGASGSFWPPNITLPVTISNFSTREDGAGVSNYLGHVNLDGKGYLVPRSGIIQLTLFNPQNTVVHMFVVHYYLEDMPTNSCTFLRQRTLLVPVTFNEIITDWYAGHGANFPKFIIHLRFCSGKHGNIYLTPDIKFLIFNRADADTACVIKREEAEPMYRIRTQTITPEDPKYSPRS